MALLSVADNRVVSLLVKRVFSSNIRHYASKHQALISKHQAPSIKHQTSSTKHQALSKQAAGKMLSDEWICLIGKFPAKISNNTSSIIPSNILVFFIFAKQQIPSNIGSAPGWGAVGWGGEGEHPVRISRLLHLAFGWLRNSQTIATNECQRTIM